MIIGIVSRKTMSVSRRVMYGVYESYLKRIINLKASPIIISPVSKKEDLFKILDFCDGIILPGGDEYLEWEEEILKYCIDRDKPILGICLGMQVMGLLDGGELKKIEGHYKTFHQVKIVKGTILDSIYHKNIRVNSRHHEIIDKVNKYVVSAYNNVIEAIEYPVNTFNVGIQWHPEDIDDEIFKKFLEAVNKKRLTGI